MGTIFEIRLGELRVAHNGVSRNNLKKATNPFEAILHFPNSQNPKALTVKSMHLLSDQKYLEEIMRYYSENLDQELLKRFARDTLLQLKEQQLKVDATLFKISIEGKSTLEMNVGVAEDNSKIEKVILDTIGVAVKIAVSAIPGVGSILSGLLGPAISSLFKSGDGTKLQSIGRTMVEIDENMAKDGEVVIKKELFVQNDVKISPIKKWAWTDHGGQAAEIVEVEPEETLKRGSKNGYVDIVISRVY